MPLTPGVGVTGPVVPKYTVDTYPAHRAIYGQGGWRTVADHAARNALTTTYPLRCEQGMVVVTLDDNGIAWQLGPEPWSGTDSDWSTFSLSAIPAHTILANNTGIAALPSGVTTNLKIDSSYGLINVVADGATITFDLDVSNKHRTVLGGNRTLAVTNAKVGQTFLIQLGQGTGGRTVTWFSGITWPDSAPPTLSTQAGVFDEVILTCESSGIYFGRLAAQNIGGTSTPTPTPTSTAYAVARFLAGPDSDIVVANDIANWVPLVGSGTIAGGFINSKAGDGPVGSDLILDVKMSTDGGSTWTSLWALTPANLPTITDGDTIGSVGVPDTTSYNNGNLVRLDAIQVGSGTPGKNAILVLF